MNKRGGGRAFHPSFARVRAYDKLFMLQDVVLIKKDRYFMLFFAKESEGKMKHENKQAADAFLPCKNGRFKASPHPSVSG